MRSVRFILSKHPYDFQGGDTRLTRLIIDLVAESAHVGAFTLSDGSAADTPIQMTFAPKGRPKLVQTGFESLRRRHSLIHTRFATQEMESLLREATDELYIAEHTYMAEPFLRARPGEAGTSLYINSHVAESSVLRASRRSWLSRWEAARTHRDELRCAIEARSVVCFDPDECSELVAAGARARRLDLSLEPQGGPAHATPPNLVFLGDRNWAPNFLALERLLRYWPEIHRRAPMSNLLVVGAGPVPRASYSDGLKFEGFLPSLDELWKSARALVAPISIGGGVRVKVLEAAARGVPVVTTPVGLGAIGTYLPIVPARDEAMFVDMAVELLLDPKGAAQTGATLFDANKTRWLCGVMQRSVEDWLRQ